MPQGITVSNVCACVCAHARVCVCACACVCASMYAGTHKETQYKCKEPHASIFVHSHTPLLSYKKSSVLRPHRDVAKQLFIEYYEIFQLHIESGMKLHGQPIYVSLLL